MQAYRKQRLFSKQTTFSWSFALLLLLSVFLMFLDEVQQHALSVRHWVSMWVAPLQYTVDYPQRMWRLGQSFTESKTALVQENNRLHYKQALLEAKLQRLQVLKAENTTLKALLKNTEAGNIDAIGAQVLDVAVSQTRQLLVIDKGSLDGLMPGQAVIDTKGVMGQLIEVGESTSIVMLVSDGKSAVPVRNQRSGEWAILMGMNRSDELVLLNLPQTSTVMQGDTLVTSGMGGHYPQGYPVGIVTDIQHVQGEPFLQVAVKPVARINQSHLVLVLFDSQQTQAQLSKQIHARLQALGVMRA